MSGLGDLLQKAAGLGLAGVKGAAQIAGRGLGIAPAEQQTGMFGSPAQYQDAGLGDYAFSQNPIGNVLLRAQNAIGSSEGRGMGAASGGLSQQRAAGNEQRLKAFQQGTELLTQFDAIRDRASPEDYERIDGLLRKRFAEVAGGKSGEADEFYDTFMSGRSGHTAALLQMAQNDPGAQQIIASGGGMGDLRKYFTSPEKLKEALDLADQKALPEIRTRIQEALTSSDPALREKIEKVRQPGGGLTLEGVLQAAPDLLGAAQRATAYRHDSELTDLNLTATPEILKRREAGSNSDLRRQEDAAKEHQKHLDDMELQALRNKGLADRPAKPKAPGRIMQYQWQAARYANRMKSADAVFEKLLGQGYDRTSIRAGAESMLPNAARSSERQQQDQAERDFVNAVLRDESGAVISQGEFDSARKQYFPVIGDSLDTVKQKAANRQRVIDNMRTEAGDAWDRMQSGQPPAEEPPAPAAPGLGQVKMRFTDAAGKSVDKMVPAADIAKWETAGGVRVP